MKNILLVFVLLGSTAVFSQQQMKTIKGKITDGRNPIEDVAIAINQGSNEAFSNAEGNYEIKATVGDQIIYTYSGLKTVRIKVEDVTRILNITMVPDV